MTLCNFDIVRLLGYFLIVLSVLLNFVILSKMADGQWYLPPNHTESHQISLYFTKSHRLTESHLILPNLTISHRISPYLIKSHRIFPYLTKFNWISPYLIKSHHISHYVIKSSQISQNITILQGAGACFFLKQVYFDTKHVIISNLSPCVIPVFKFSLRVSIWRGAGSQCKCLCLTFRALACQPYF